MFVTMVGIVGLVFVGISLTLGFSASLYMYRHLSRPIISVPAPLFNQMPYYGCFQSISTGSDGRIIHKTSYNRCKNHCLTRIPSVEMLR